MPISITIFSFSVAVGQACTQAPQDTHSDSRNGSAWLGRDERLEAAARDGQREGALHLLAGAHAARADDALRGIEGEIGIGIVDAGIGVPLAVVAVAHLAQADRAGHVLQLAVAVGRAGQAVERMVGDVELHHALAQPLQPLGLGVHHHAFGDRRGAGGRRAAAALDLDQAQPAGAEGLEPVGGAELRDLAARARPPRA